MLFITFDLFTEKKLDESTNKYILNCARTNEIQFYTEFSSKLHTSIETFLESERSEDLVYILDFECSKECIDFTMMFLDSKRSKKSMILQQGFFF